MNQFMGIIYAGEHLIGYSHISTTSVVIDGLYYYYGIHTSSQVYSCAAGGKRRSINAKARFINADISTRSSSNGGFYALMLMHFFGSCRL